MIAEGRSAAVPPLAIERSDQAFRDARSGTRTPYLASRPSGAGGKITLVYDTFSHWSWERRLRGGCDAGARPGEIGHARAMTRKPGSGAPALRKYAFDANAIGKLCMRAMKWGARRQLQELYGARGSRR
eukprot:311739-Pleurochrysis_carterae.AAC.1